MKELLKQYVNKQVSIMVKDSNKAKGGILEVVGEDCIVLNPRTNHVDRIIIAISEITSILVSKSVGEDNGNGR